MQKYSVIMNSQSMANELINQSEANTMKNTTIEIISIAMEKYLKIKEDNFLYYCECVDDYLARTEMNNLDKDYFDSLIFLKNKSYKEKIKTSVAINDFMNYLEGRDKNENN